MTQTGAELGHYRLGRLLGTGGMGEVYLARDLALDRDVAIKLLPEAKDGDRQARRRFLKEAQAAAKLDHPNICQVFDVGETPSGRAFIAMSFVEGSTLASRLASGPLPVRDALVVAREIADALHAAHAHGVVHRDLKPQNVMITPSGRAKLLDFGVAQIRLDGPLATDTSTESGDTAPGVVVGTPAYMSPEQIAGQPVDGRSDLFALGALLYECLTGRRAFVGQTTASVMGAVLHQQPPPASTLRGDVPAGVDELCARLLAKAPADRFQTADEVIGALRVLLPTTEATRPEPVVAARRWRGLAAATAIGLGVATGGLWLQSRPRLPEPPEAAQHWYRLGTTFIRDGAYHSAAAALDQAIATFPQFAFAYARRAEALAELDDQTRASELLLRMQQLLGDESRLPEVDRVRLDAIRATVLRDLPRAVRSYRTLVERAPSDAGLWVDLGRAQEAAEQRGDAEACFTRAIALDQGMAAAHLRLARLHAFAGRREPAVEAFSRAEQIYRAASNVEGQTEVAVQRGEFFDGRGELELARQDLERAQRLSREAGAALNIRARIAYGSLMVSEGKIRDAEVVITEAVEDARRNELWTLVATGLIETGALLVNQPARARDADARVEEAERLAAQRGAQRTAARATLQRASLALQRGDPARALALATKPLDFLRQQGYRRLELTARSIVGRAQRDLDDPTAAQQTATAVLTAARELRDDSQVAVALTSLAGAQTFTGDLVGALASRVEAEAVNRRIGNQNAVPFALINRAELLIRLGRHADAEPLLLEVERGIEQGVEGYAGRASRLAYLRALSAVVAGDHTRMAAQRRRLPAGGTDAAWVLTRTVLAFGLAGRRGDPGPAPDAGNISQFDDRREQQYWRALDAAARGQHARALAVAREALESARRTSNDEQVWRLAAVAARAAGRAGDIEAAHRLWPVATQALERLRTRLATGGESYERRADLRELIEEVRRTRPSTP